MLNITVAPLPPGWTEHRGPNNQLYFYNAITRESTYMRPAGPVVPQTEQVTKEKPHTKILIPETDWYRVTTTKGNVFYSNKITKQSLWDIPEELKLALDAWQAERQASAETDDASGSKRKLDDSVDQGTAKKVKYQEEEDEDESEDELEDWQREAAEQLAEEAEQARLEEQQRIKESEAEAEQMRALVPDKVNLSLEEGKALFKVLLREKDINPLHPWDMSLPKFVSDPRYVLLPTVASRREAFDEYCKERLRENKSQAVKKEKETINPKDEFERLLKDEVKSTRASWTDFRKAWKKDRRFYGWGRDDKERERRFRDYLKELGEKKRQAAQKAEADFFAMLKENSLPAGAPWKDVKSKMHRDPRYDAVGSSTLREELYNTFLKGRAVTPQAQAEPAVKVEDPSAREERRDKAVREREEKVKADRRKLDSVIEKSRMGVDREEGERIFRTLLTDAIRDPQLAWEDALPQLKTDPRFTNSPLPPPHQQQLFYSHLAHLQSRHQDNLKALFESHTTSLASTFSDLPLDSLLSSPPVTRLGYDKSQLEREYTKWQRERNTAARIAFDQMLSENSFVEFWGRLGKLGTEALANDLKIEDDDLGEDTEQKVDMKTLAKNVDIHEMEKVLKNDKRYIVFDHVPEQRAGWLRDYLANLAAPKLSVHVSN